MNLITVFGGKIFIKNNGEEFQKFLLYLKTLIIIIKRFYIQLLTFMA